MRLFVLRIAFFLVAIGIATLMVSLSQGKGPAWLPWLAFLGVLALAGVVIAIDIFIPRKQIDIISAVYVGLAVGAFLTYILMLALTPLLPPIDETSSNREQALAIRAAIQLVLGMVLCYACISLLLQSLRDQWIPDDQKPKYFDILRRLFFFFYITYLDQEHGYLVIRDEERTTVTRHTTRMANFDGARYLCQWSRLAKLINAPDNPRAEPVRTSGRFVIFDKGNRKEQGLFLYRDAESGLHIELPLAARGDHRDVYTAILARFLAEAATLPPRR